MPLISFSFFAWPDRICSFDLRAIVRMMRCVEMNHSFPEPPCAFPHGTLMEKMVKAKCIK